MATTSPRTILVTGATGKQGSAVIDALLSANESDKAFSIIAVTRDTNSRSAQALARRPNVSVVTGDLADPDELTQPEADAIFQEVLGFSMPMAPSPIGSAVKFFKKDTVGDMFRWFEENGYSGHVVQCRKEFPA